MLGERRPWLKEWGVPGIVLLILGGLWFLTLALVKANAYATLANILILFLPVLLVIGLYWMRWWFIHTVPSGLETPSMTWRISLLLCRAWPGGLQCSWQHFSLRRDIWMRTIIMPGGVNWQRVMA